MRAADAAAEEEGEGARPAWLARTGVRAGCRACPGTCTLPSHARRGSPMNAPARIGPYRIVGMVGEGGMGVVYRGEHTETGERVAVKTVRVPQEADLA